MNKLFNVLSVLFLAAAAIISSNWQLQRAVSAESLDEVIDDLKLISFDESALRELAGKDRFKPYVLNPILSPGLGTQGAWDAGALGTACVVKVDGVYHMYYEAWGALTAEGGKRTVRHPPNRPRGFA